MAYKLDLTGKRYGKLTVLEFAYTDPKSRKSYWKCRCDCGREKIICASNLKSGNTSSCGCGEVENRKKLMDSFYKDHIKHGMSESRIHKIWAHMKERCSNPNSKDYPLYGGRGISVCPEWDDPNSGFVNFFDWALSNGYRDDLTIDRADTNGNYEPGNCRWSNAIEQSNNRRTNRLVTLSGDTKTLAEWCRTPGKNYSTIYYRLQSGMTPEEAFDIK